MANLMWGPRCARRRVRADAEHPALRGPGDFGARRGLRKDDDGDGTPEPAD